jgi:Lhr-like helicase
MEVERTAMTKRRFRHCMSRSAAISMSARLHTP